MRPVVLFDVDCTVVDASAHHLRPGILEMFEVLKALGYEIDLWSAAGEWYVRDVLAEHQALRKFVSKIYDKPDPVRVPSGVRLTVDDSPRERDPHCTFVRFNPYFGPKYLVDGQVPVPNDRWED